MFEKLNKNKIVIIIIVEIVSIPTRYLCSIINLIVGYVVSYVFV